MSETLFISGLALNSIHGGGRHAAGHYEVKKRKEIMISGFPDFPIINIQYNTQKTHVGSLAVLDSN